MKDKKNCTIKDLAKSTGLAISTVSRALQANRSCHPNTRKKVLAVAREMNYLPNFSARSLVSNKTHAIGLVLHTFENQILKKLIVDLSQLLADKNYDLQILFNPNCKTSAKRLVNTILSRGLDGIIYHSPVFSGRQPILDMLLERNLPCIALDLFSYTPPLDRVARNFYEAGMQVTQHLLDVGHRRIAFIGTVLSDPRINGYHSALKQAGIPLDESLLFTCSPNQEAVEKTVKAVIQSDTTAIFTNYDGMAALVLQALRETNIRVPQDIALAGVGNESYSNLLNPPLTTYDVYNEHLASHLVELLFSRIEAPDSATRTILLEGRLLVRESTKKKAPPWPVYAK